ncbi:Xylose operon regulatory protein [compost metagenome]
MLLLLADLTERGTYSYHGIDDRTLEILNYISSNYKDISLDSIAHKFNYNSSYLSRYIKQNVGKPLSTLLNEIRMNKASQLLSDSSISVHSIAEELGYKSYSHFHKVFKEWFNTTPNEYRQKAK